MASRPRPEKKSKPAVPAGRGVLPMELQVGDHRRDRGVGSDRPAVQHGGRKGRPRARPENERTRQLGDTKLGRVQAHQCEADDRRGGQITWTAEFRFKWWCKATRGRWEG